MLRLIAAIIVGFAVWATPEAINRARDMRGYDAIGGEYLLIPLAILIAAGVYTISKTWQDFFFPAAEIASDEEVIEDGSTTSPANMF